MNVAIIVAAGRGMRMKDESGTPKQFRHLKGTPLIVHTLRCFELSEAIDEIVVAVPADARRSFLSIREQYAINKLKSAVTGGDTRAESVWRALESLDALRTEIVAVHDGARPFVTPADIDRVVCRARESGAAILTMAATDTIKEVEDGRVLRTLPRSRLRHALTPQCFRYELLCQAYLQAQATDWREATDDSALVESLGVTVDAIDGDDRNIKITRPEDWATAERMMERVISDE